jgi:hypothetical protein
MVEEKPTRSEGGYQPEVSRIVARVLNAETATERGWLGQLIQPCSWKRFFMTCAISLAVDLARPSTLLLPLASP